MDSRTYNVKKISVVIPALNEEQGLGQTIRAIPKDELERLGYEVHILVVDNGSQDGTADAAREAGAEVVDEPRRGYGRALKAGFACAKGGIIVTTDADGTYPVEEIPRLVQILENETLDFLTTNRLSLLEKEAMPFRNRIGNRILSLAMRLLFRVDIKDSQSGMWVFRSNLLEKMILKFNSMALSEEIKIEACHYAKTHWKETHIKYRIRLGEIKLRRWRDGAGNLFCLVKKRVVR